MSDSIIINCFLSVENENSEIKNLIYSFESEIDNFPNGWSYEIWVINNCSRRGLNWRGVLYRELISTINSMLKKQVRLCGEITTPITVDFNFLGSLFLSPNFGLKMRVKLAPKK